MRVYGLIGYPLSHSFSKRHFTEKFQQEFIKDARYENFEIKDLAGFQDILQNNPALRGLNVTIPHKQEVIKYMASLDHSASFVGAVNVIKFEESGKLTGYNSDYYGFMESLKRFLPFSYEGIKALVLGTGGAAKAVEGALKTLNIPFAYVSRQKEAGRFTYEEVDERVVAEHRLIINTSPLGMYPQVDSFPALPYEFVTRDHFLFDLVYNPEETEFMKKGKHQGAQVKNGLEMLHLQAEKAWEIWNL